jgi:hypothetical protein
LVQTPALSFRKADTWGGRPHIWADGAAVARHRTPALGGE